MGTAIAIWLFGTIIFFIILYNVIRAALDDSKMARNIQEIKDLLSKNKSNTSRQSELREDVNESFEVCPACGRKVSPIETTCPECGLKLSD